MSKLGHFDVNVRLLFSCSDVKIPVFIRSELLHSSKGFQVYICGPICVHQLTIVSKNIFIDGKFHFFIPAYCKYFLVLYLKLMHYWHSLPSHWLPRYVLAYTSQNSSLVDGFLPLSTENFQIFLWNHCPFAVSNCLTNLLISRTCSRN